MSAAGHLAAPTLAGPERPVPVRSV